MLLIYLEWVVSRKSNNKSVELDSQKTIGRNADNTFVIKDSRVSGKQATIHADGANAIITNVSTTNNIQVGSEIVSKNGGTAILTDKATIAMGKTSIFVRTTSVVDGTTDYVVCTTCSKPIPSGTTTCPWCKSSQTGTNAAYTMA